MKTSIIDTATVHSPAPSLCYHCGLAVADTQRYTVQIDGIAQPVCCPGCQAVVEAITGSGLGNYYRFRDQVAARPVATNEFSHFDQADFAQRWLTTLADDSAADSAGEAAKKIVQCELLINGMQCAACVWLLENRLRKLPGMHTVQIDLDAQRGTISWDSNVLLLSTICHAIAAIGYQPQPYCRDEAEQLRQREQQRSLRQLGVAGIGMMQVGMLALGLYAGASDGIEPLYRDLLRWTSLIVTVPVLLYSGQPFFSGAWRGLRVRRANMDLPIALALVLAFVASAWATVQRNGEVYFDSVSMFIFLLLGSRYLEMRARHYRSAFGNDLLSLLPSAVARLDSDGRYQIVPLDRLRCGDTVLVKSGAVLPADGNLLDSHASINEAALTGEYLPVRKQRGDLLLAGSVNGEQALTFKISGVGAQLRIAGIHALTRQAQAWKPRLTQMADRVAGVFVAAIIILAALTYGIWHWLDPQRAFWIALSVLVVSCPCALSLATPMALTNATNALRRRGVLVTQADAWEQLPTITDVVFDKTGTLSAGCVSIVDVVACGALLAEHCRDIAAALETGSSHPIAAAFADRIVAAADHCKNSAGSGVEGFILGQRYRLGIADFALSLSGRCATPPSAGHWILLADNNGPLCWFRLQDQLRADAAAAIAALRQRGLRLHLLSGDRSGSALEIAAQLQIEQVAVGCTPEQKLAYVENLQRDARRVMMVGDGINDIPVLAAANVSVAMSNASQLAKTNADCILLAPRLDRLLALLEGGHKTQHIVRENLYWALIYNAIAVPLAAIGMVSPWLAAVGMSLSSLFVSVNALRLSNFKIKQTSNIADKD